MAVPQLGRQSLGSFGFVLMPLIVVLVGVQAGTGERCRNRTEERTWRAGEPVGIVVRNGRATFRVPAPVSGSECVVIASALGRSAGSFPLRLRAESVDRPADPERVIATHLVSQSAATLGSAALGDPPRRSPAMTRDFHMMVRDGDVTSRSNYLAIRGILRAVGKRIQIYVAIEDVPKVERALLEDMVTTFDDRILPVSAQTVGVARDIDGDGRFTILLSSWLGRLGNGKHAVDGFVRVTDLDPLYAAPFGNHCDMMYLSASLRPGPHLRTIMAHEYMHAVAFTQKTSRPTGRGPVVVEEEGWLDEALAHLAEDQHGFSRSNINYRVSAFLSQPERYQLVVDDYYAADLFRSHGHRGATYLFLRWCVDQYGPGLVPALASSRLKGVANLELATGSAFADLFRRWSVALFASDLDTAHARPVGGFPGYRSFDVRTPSEDWQLAGPRTTMVLADGPEDQWDAAPTSSHFTIVRSKSAGGIEVTVTGPPEADVQVTAIPLPDDMARLELAAKATSGPDGELRLRATVREGGGGPVRLLSLAWEPLVPSADRQMLGSRHGELDMLGIASNFGTSALAAGARVNSRPIRLHGVHADTGPLVIKLIGTDARGRRVAAWAEVNSQQRESSAEALQPLANQGS